MTCREWVTKNKPDLLRNFAGGGVMDCPHSVIPGVAAPDNCQHNDQTCTECWDREIPEAVAKSTPAAKNTPAVTKSTTATDDPVNHPSHYTAGGIECIDAIGAALCRYTDPVDAWLAGQVIKYLWRAPLKGAYRQDIRKAKFYLDRMTARQEAGEK